MSETEAGVNVIGAGFDFFIIGKALREKVIQIRYI